MRILVTGATGYIGSSLARKFVQDGHHCRILVRGSSSNLDALRDLPRIELYYGDIARKDKLLDICDGIDVVINAAGILGKWNSSVGDLRPVNAFGIANLVEESLKSSVEYIVHLSAGGVTGPVKGPPADESYECRPGTPYEKTKLEGERIALNFYAKYKMPIVVVRPTFTYGPGDPHKLPLFRAIKAGTFAFLGSGLSTNHPVYIDDLVAGILLLLQKRPVGETYIIGGDMPVTKICLVNTIATILGVKKPSLHIPKWLASCGAHSLVFLGRIFKFEPVLTPSRVSMLVDNWGYSTRKARCALGYKPKVDLEAGLRQTVKTYKELGWL